MLKFCHITAVSICSWCKQTQSTKIVKEVSDNEGSLNLTLVKTATCHQHSRAPGRKTYKQTSTEKKKKTDVLQGFVIGAAADWWEAVSGFDTWHLACVTACHGNVNPIWRALKYRSRKPGGRRVELQGAGLSSKPSNLHPGHNTGVDLLNQLHYRQSLRTHNV